MVGCAFEDRCINAGDTNCDFCHYNPEACTQDYFEYDEDCGLPKPTQEELNNEIQNW